MTQSLSRGTVLLMFAEAVALVSSYGLQVWIAYYLGAEAYGIFGVITSLYLINRAFLNTGIPRATSKFAAEAKDNVGAIFRTSLKVQLWFALAFGAAYVIFAKFIAGILHDPSLTPYIIYLGIMVIPFSLLALFSTGYLNGMHMFREQALIKSIYPFLQAVFSFILVLLGFRIFGVITGYFLAVVVGLLMCLKYIKFEKNPQGHFSAKKLLMFSIPISLSALCFTTLRHVNPLFVKAILGDNKIVALFTSAATLSSVPFSVFGALPVALLPGISRALSENNIEKARKYISKSIRYSLLVLMPLSALVAALAEQILGLLYPAYYQQAALTLGILIFASSFLAIFTTLNAIIVGSGKPILQLSTVSLMVGLLVILNIILIPIYGIVGSALASLISSALAVLIDSIHAYRHFGMFLDFFSVFRITLGSIGLFLLAHYWHYSGWLLIPYFVFVGLLYLGFMIMIGEITGKDWQFAKNAIFFWK